MPPKSDTVVQIFFQVAGSVLGLHNICHNAMVFQLKRKVAIQHSSFKMGPCGRNLLAYRLALMEPCALSEVSLFSSGRIPKSLSSQHILQASP